MTLPFPPELLKDGRTRQQRQIGLEILAAALRAVDPSRAVHRHVVRQGELVLVGGHVYDLRQVDRVLVVGAGKAGGAMALALEEILDDRLSDGVVVVPHGQTVPTRRIRLCHGAHPTPDEDGLACSRQIADLLASATEHDLVFCLISGGGSALLLLPEDGLSLEDLQQVTSALLRSGATIGEVNVVRKHLDRLKGGGLARLARPAQLVSLILSDVLGSPLDAIASGPTAPDPTTFRDACAVIDRYALWDALPAGVAQRLRQGASGNLPETLKPRSPLFDRVHNILIGSNQEAAEAALAQAKRCGLHALLLSAFVEGEAREVGKVLGALARQLATSGHPLPRPACLVLSGETTVTVTGHGRGGRNQEVALGAALGLDGLADVLVMSAATDGVDGPTDAAGALADGTTLARARQRGLDPRAALASNDAYHFFEPLGDLLKIGPTGTNVNDLMLVLAF